MVSLDRREIHMVYLSQLWTTFLVAGKQFLSQLNWMDIFVITILLRASYIGVRKGLFIEIVKLSGLLVGLLVAITQHPRLGQELSVRLNLHPALSRNVAFWALLFVAYLGVRLIGFILEKALKVEGGGFWSRFCGAVAGVVRGSLLVACILTGSLLTGSSYLTESIQKKSLLAPFFVKGGAATYASLHQFSASFTIEGFDYIVLQEPNTSD